MVTLLTVIWCFIRQKNQEYFLDGGVHSQYTFMNVFYQTWNYTKFFDEKSLYFDFGDMSSEKLKAPIVCSQTWCVSPYTLQFTSLEGEFVISINLVYKTLIAGSDRFGPYYFCQIDPIHIKKGEEIKLDHSFVYTNLSWTDVPIFLPKKYWSFVFQNPVEIYYNICPTYQIETWSYAKFSLKEK